MPWKGRLIERSSTTGSTGIPPRGLRQNLGGRRMSEEASRSSRYSGEEREPPSRPLETPPTKQARSPYGYSHHTARVLAPSTLRHRSVPARPSRRHGGRVQQVRGGSGDGPNPRRHAQLSGRRGGTEGLRHDRRARQPAGEP